jgi:hypothetical protein
MLHLKKIITIRAPFQPLAEVPGTIYWVGINGEGTMHGLMNNVSMINGHATHREQNHAGVLKLDKKYLLDTL